MTPDRYDICIGGGLVIATVGIALLSVAWALVALGGTLFTLGCIGLWRRSA